MKRNEKYLKSNENQWTVIQYTKKHWRAKQWKAMNSNKKALRTNRKQWKKSKKHWKAMKNNEKGLRANEKPWRTMKNT